MKNIFLPIFILLIFNACTKVIDIDLNSATPKIVIEGALQAGTQDFTVHITKTSNYFDTDQPATIGDATVFLQKGHDAPIELRYVSNGNYTLNNYLATENETYFLTVNAEGKTYEASSFLPKPVVLDSLTAEASDQPSFGTVSADTFQVFSYFQEPAAETNFYRFKTVLNSVPQNKGEDLIVTDDRLVNGNYIRIPLFTANYELHDTVEVELVSMDAKMFDYFNTLTLVVSQGNTTAAPTNPNTNWSGGALGYFGAFSSTKAMIVVK